MQNTNSTFIFKLAAIAAAVSMHGVALAQPAPASPAAPVTEQSSTAPDMKRGGHSHKFHKHHGHMHGHHQHHRAAMLVPGYGPLGEKSVEALKLSDDQKKLLQDAREAQKTQRAERSAAFKEQRKERHEALKAGKLDPRAALEQAKQHREAVAERHDEIASKWLAVWDALDDDQRKLVAQQFAERAEKRAEYRKKHAERHAKSAEASQTAPSKPDL